MRKIFVAILSLFVFFEVRAAQVANVEYIHNLIERNWGIELPYNTELKDVKLVANMEYLLTAIDAANSRLNNGVATEYRNTKYATKKVVDVDAVNMAVEKLIEKK